VARFGLILLSLGGLTIPCWLGCTPAGQQDQDVRSADAAGQQSSSQKKPASPATEKPSAGSATRESGLPEQESAEAVAPLAGLLAKRDPAQDLWKTEVFNEVAGSQLKQLGKLLSHPAEITADELSRLATERVSVTPLRPESLETLYSTAAISVLVQSESPHANSSDPPQTGREALRQAIESLAKPFAGTSNVHTKFKIIRVQTAADHVETDVYFQADGPTSQGIVQQNATWKCRWVQQPASSTDQSSELKLTSITVSDFRESIGSADGQPLLADCSRAVLGANASFDDQLMKSTNHWRRTLEASLGIDVFGHQGLAIGDSNGDGLQDVYVCQAGGVPNRLYVQNADGTARDESARSGLDILDRSRSALFLDLDNDGDQDLVLLLSTSVALFANDGQGKFTLKLSQSVGTVTTLTAADYDNDADLDIYVCGYSAPTGGESAPVPYHDANNGNENRLLSNLGNWQFSDVTQEVGLDQDNTRYSFSASWEDFDNDGDMDLYVANDYGRNCLYRNDHSTTGQFVNIAPQAGVEDLSAGMGASWGDYNNDGLMDLYVSNMFSSAGNRVAYQRQFRTDDDSRTRSDFQRHARGNSLFENAGDGTFRDVTLDANVAMGRWAWGSLFADINNDGWRDLLVTNGMATNEDTDDL